MKDDYYSFPTREVSMIDGRTALGWLQCVVNEYCLLYVTTHNECLISLMGEVWKYNRRSCTRNAVTRICWLDTKIALLLPVSTYMVDSVSRHKVSIYNLFVWCGVIGGKIVAVIKSGIDYLENRMLRKQLSPRWWIRLMFDRWAWTKNEFIDRVVWFDVGTGCLTGWCVRACIDRCLYEMIMFYVGDNDIIKFKPYFLSANHKSFLLIPLSYSLPWIQTTIHLFWH